jgi:hypothetical protein
VDLTDRNTALTPRAWLAAAPVAAGAALISSLWIAICAAAPEFIWQGVVIAFGHSQVTDLVGALLVGLILAFFVEPLMERARAQLLGGGRKSVRRARGRNVFFTASLSLAFALAAVCIHEAMSAFVSSRYGTSGRTYAGVAAGIGLTEAWAIVPFAITLAWMALRTPWLARTLAPVAVASPFFAGWLFSWSTQSLVATVIPCLIILGLGYRRLLRTPRSADLAACARTVALVGSAWLLCAALFDASLPLFGAERLRLYGASGFWVDARFYLGWSLGLLIAPSPFPRRHRRKRQAAGS